MKLSETNLTATALLMGIAAVCISQWQHQLASLLIFLAIPVGVAGLMLEQYPQQYTLGNKCGVTTAIAILGALGMAFLFISMQWIWKEVDGVDRFTMSLLTLSVAVFFAIITGRQLRFVWQAA